MILGLQFHTFLGIVITLYVSRGIGTTFSPVRLNAPPEVSLLHLT
jgi:predicted MPP superfamily phosphohydrolase